MAKQCGPIFFERTWCDITFYKMDGQHYARSKSSLTREQVLTLKAFEKTRFYANLLAISSKVASSIYSDLPIEWRQFWMYREFTGEGILMLEGGSTPQEVYDYLWETYVKYWALYQHITGIPLKTGRTARKAKPKTNKPRIKHCGGFDKHRRYAKLIGKNHWKSSYDHMADILEIDKKRECKALNDAAYQRTLDKERKIREEQLQQEAALLEAKKIIQGQAPVKTTKLLASVPKRCHEIRRTQQGILSTSIDDIFSERCHLWRLPLSARLYVNST